MYTICFKQLFVLVLLFFFINAQQNDSCDQLHPNCVFISAVGLSGSTTLTDILNQHPQIHIRGENYGMFNHILKVMMENVQWGADYEETLKNKDFKNIQHFSTISLDRAYFGVQQMFKQFFAHDDNKDKIIGFKEIRFQHDDQLDFVRGLCKNSKIIFQYHTDTYNISQRLWYKSNPKAKQQMEERIGKFHIYNRKFPDETFISTVSDFRKPDYVKNLFNFLGLSLEGVEIDVGRLYKREQEQLKQQKLKQQQEKERKKLEEQKKQGQSVNQKLQHFRSQFVKSKSNSNYSLQDIAKQNLNNRISQFFNLSHGYVHQRFQRQFNVTSKFQIQQSNGSNSTIL